MSDKTSFRNYPIRSVTQFFSWWTGQLDQFFSRITRADTRWKTLLHKTNDGLNIYVRSAKGIEKILTLTDDGAGSGNARALSQINGHPLSGSGVVLRLSSDQTLKRELTLPEEIIDVIEPVLENQVAQMVPWPADQSCFGYRFRDAENLAGKVRVELVVIRLKTVEKALSHAAKLGFKPSRIDVADDFEQPMGLNLSYHKNIAINPSRNSTTSILASIFAIFLIVGVINSARLFNAHSDLEQAERKMAVYNMNNSQVAEARSTNAELIQQRNWLISQRGKTRPVAVIIDALTRLFPDDTHVTKLEMSGSKIIITGRAKNAAELIDKLEQSKHFRDVRFYSPTLRNSRGAVEVKEIFSIEVALELMPVKGGKT